MNMAPLFSDWKCKSTEGAVSYVSCGGLVTSALQNSGQVRRRASRPDNSFLFCGVPSNFAALWGGCVGLIFIFWYFSRRKQQHWLRCIRVHRRLARSERCTAVGVCHHGSDAVASGSASYLCTYLCFAVMCQTHSGSRSCFTHLSEQMLIHRMTDTINCLSKQQCQQTNYSIGIFSPSRMFWFYFGWLFLRSSEIASAARPQNWIFKTC